MHQTNQQATSFFLLAAFAAAVTAGEYYFLQAAPAHTKLYLLSLKFFAKGGFWFRLLLLVAYPLAFACVGAGLKAKSKRSGGKKWIAGTLLWLLCFSGSTLLLLTVHHNPYFKFAYPAGLLGLFVSGYPVGRLLRVPERKPNTIQNDTCKEENRYSFHFPCRDGSWVNVTNPFRGTLVIGGAGSGKSYSVAEPILAQAAMKGYSGILYDFKFPTLTDFAYCQYARSEHPITFWVINFEDLSRSHRVNPLDPKYIPAPAYASEYALAILNNLMPETISKPDFWTRSAQALLTATIWYLSRYHPTCCTVPHVLNLITGGDYHALLDMLAKDYSCASMIRSILTAVENGASNQIAGMVSTLQLALARINTPEICYVLSGNEFSLDLNDPTHPKILCVGTSPTLCETFSPVISCLVTVALKQMNQQGKHHSFVLLDEGPTLYIPKLDQLPATARSNKVATVYMAQDFAQMKKQYGQNEADALIANLNNQFFGRVASLSTAEYVSRLFGKEDRLLRSEGHSDNQSKGSPLGLVSKASSGSYGSSVSYSLQERSVIHPQALLQLEVGNFLGNTVETSHSSFLAHFKKTSYQREALPPITTGVNVELNYERIILEARAIVQGSVASDTQLQGQPFH